MLASLAGFTLFIDTTLQNAPFRRYKSWLHEGGITTPMIAWWPNNIEAGLINRDVAHIIDLLPTFLELGGGKYPEQFDGNKLLPVEGKSMTKLFKGESRTGHQQICWQWSGNRAIRQGDWKLVWDKLNPDKKWELYNLAQDRCEIEDLASQHRERANDMAQDWFAWAELVEVRGKKSN